MKENKNLRLMMRALFGSLLLTLLISAQETTVPIMTPYYLFGGSKDGKWVKAETVAPQIKDRTKMFLVNLKGAEKTSATIENTGEDFGACPENKVFKLTPEIESGILVGANAKWNLVPRIPQQIAVTDKTYQKIAADFLKTKGINQTKTKLGQIISVDLEGDGQTEIVIAGNFYRKGMTEEQSAGDYSFVLLRKTIKGKPQNILIEGDFFTKKGVYDPPNEREIAALADLNGDGKMEIVLHTFYYEGSWERVFEISGGKLTKVLEVSCLV